MKEVILLWILSCFLLQERLLITTEDIRVSIDAQKREIVVEMKNLFSMAYYYNEKEMVVGQLQKVQKQNFEWSTIMYPFYKNPCS